eukprot:gnl/MRDRNA2_/MRDRNA2_19111_c0_seq1.p1 gnl/MRDRNA2_/MRDRNA2_19111_c0~~gnl/MRDRNA2_/MRDRNA2_19111_c0_seq1.p1  ORF type:complete len:174 (-),score=34.14 gnl/MRDRNA2_/MRDRNA2_19111_c0_seq1:87-608(-)
MTFIDHDADQAGDKLSDSVPEAKEVHLHEEIPDINTVPQQETKVARAFQNLKPSKEGRVDIRKLPQAFRNLGLNLNNEFLEKIKQDVERATVKHVSFITFLHIVEQMTFHMSEQKDIPASVHKMNKDAAEHKRLALMNASSLEEVDAKADCGIERRCTLFCWSLKCRCCRKGD